MRTAAIGAACETYHGPVEELQPLPERTGRACLLPTRQVWIGRDDDGKLCMYPSRPVWTGDCFEPAQIGEYVGHLPEDWFPEVEAGFCQCFAKTGPRVDCRKKSEV